MSNCVLYTIDIHVCIIPCSVITIFNQIVIVTSLYYAMIVRRNMIISLRAIDKARVTALSYSALPPLTGARRTWYNTHLN